MNPHAARLLTDHFDVCRQILDFDFDHGLVVIRVPENVSSDGHSSRAVTGDEIVAAYPARDCHGRGLSFNSTRILGQLPEENRLLPNRAPSSIHQRSQTVANLPRIRGEKF